MAKYLFILTIFCLSSVSFAQDYEPEPTVCNAGESCIETTTPGGNQSIFKLIQIEDVDGQNIGSKLNMNSAITDIFYEGITACYKGKIPNTCDMGELMAGNTNLEYAQGGHAQIENFKCYALNEVVNFEYDVASDYQQNLQFTKVAIEKCPQE